MVNPVELQKYLGGIDYPADKNRLLEAAKSNDAPEDVINALEKLPEKEFNAPTEVIELITQTA